MNDWTLVYTGFRPETERLREALCTLGNGFFATRGAAPEAVAGPGHYPGTYVAGCYNRLVSGVAGETLEDESLVNVPNWLPLRFRVDGGRWFDPAEVTVLDYRCELDLRDGEFRRRVRFRDADGRESTLSERRLVHARQRHTAAVELRLLAENWSGPVEVWSAIDGTVENAGVARYGALASRHLEPVAASAPDRQTLCLTMRTSSSRIEIAEAARTRLYLDGEPVTVEPEVTIDADLVGARYRVSLGEGQTLVAEKAVALYTSRDRAIFECSDEARRLAAELPSFGELAAGHQRAWHQLWRRFALNLDLPGDGGHRHTALVLRLHVFHLLQTASMAALDLDAGVPARGLHGEAYRGHVFWDELFVFPLFNLRLPEITRALLMYRYRRLDEARRMARSAGLEGAMFPWQSGSNGREESQRLHLNPKSGRWIPDNSRLQRHVSAAIAYNVWQYHQATGDDEFLAMYGAEMMLEIARLWSGLCRFEPELGRYTIRGVMGPDEYHDAYPGGSKPGIDNNAYSNVMAVWVLRSALALQNVLAPERWLALTECLALRPDELERWMDVTRRMFVPFHGDGIISQFEGYDDLKELDWSGLRRRHGDIQRLDRVLEMEGDSVNRYKASKQADVLMLFYLFSAEELTDLLQGLGYPFDPATIPDNVRYYLDRTSDGSTLSRVVHSWVLARSDREAAWQVFCDALESDVSDVQGGTTEEGIHLGAMAGTVDLVQRCFTGIEMRDGVLWLNPRLPAPLARLVMPIVYRSQVIELAFSDGLMTVRLEPGSGSARIGVDGVVEVVPAGATRVYRRDDRI